MKNIIGVLLMALVFSSCSAKKEASSYRGYELPTYTVLAQEGQTELRQYEPQLVAEVQVDGKRNQAIKEGFRILAAYIFGDNESAIKIPMTTPVTQEQSSNAWSVRFGMPKQYTIETLPKTKDARIHFTTTKPSKLAVIIFSGIVSDKTINLQTKLLEEFMTKKQLVSISDPVIAYYDNPLTFPWNRRNEIMVAVQYGPRN